MYDPLRRVYQFIPYDRHAVAQHAPAPPADAPAMADAPAPRRRRAGAKRSVFAHVVDVQELCRELEQPAYTPVRRLCALLESKKSIVLLGSMSSAALATSTAAKFGSGHLVVLVVNTWPDAPQYLALGRTAGCRADGVDVSGTLDILTAFGGESNPFTREAVEYDERRLPGKNAFARELRWHLPPQTPLGSPRRAFFRVLIKDAAPVADDATEISRDSRLSLLFKTLLSFSDSTKSELLHYFPTVQSSSSETL